MYLCKNTSYKWINLIFFIYYLHIIIFISLFSGSYYFLHTICNFFLRIIIFCTFLFSCIIITNILLFLMHYYFSYLIIYHILLFLTYYYFLTHNYFHIHHYFIVIHYFAYFTITYQLLYLTHYYFCGTLFHIHYYSLWSIILFKLLFSISHYFTHIII